MNEKIQEWKLVCNARTDNNLSYSQCCCSTIAATFDDADGDGNVVVESRRGGG